MIKFNFQTPRGEEEASSDDSLSSGFLTHSTLDEIRWDISFVTIHHHHHLHPLPHPQVPEVQALLSRHPPQLQEGQDDGQEVHGGQGAQVGRVPCPMTRVQCCPVSRVLFSV